MIYKGYQFVSYEIYMGDFVYIDEISFCNKGRLRYMINLVSSYKFNVGDEFVVIVCLLLGIYNNQIYMDFFQDWGMVNINSSYKVFILIDFQFMFIYYEIKIILYILSMW